ncbi:ACR230Cp [Eremothecium gossypii ATCC 10895]|uniref:Peroxisomal membrane protein PEX13 n=2 Tax=Eremothecium gossypii TaxID=33169 RepID=Q75BP1_EREGS|nr:ACR230Cp [Eremothecium gossypii ATCC 10895]AAS51456.1 ACR230Cp [Eremothecium gossypii ATCC 10895]AEY95747.1 FACR230Cp [Eremothecium gossypii FDAG1]
MSASKPRPKPWETANMSSATSSSGTMDESNTVIPTSVTAASSLGGGSGDYGHTPDLPTKPAGLGDESGYKSMNSQFGMNSTPYGGSMYGSGGLYGNSMYGGGGFGSMYGGGFGNGYGGYGSMYGGGYGGMYGMGANGMNNNGGIAESTQATFHLIENLIGAVAGFAQMLEATYMATHNSFLTMVSVAEQFQYVKEMLGSFFGIFAMIKFLKRVLFKLTGGRMGVAPKKQLPPASGDKGKMLQEFDQFRSGKNSAGSTGERKRARIAWKPLFLFFAAVFGFPWLLNKFIMKLQEMQNRGRIATPHQPQSLDLNSLEFARAIYDFTPENPRIECALKKGDLMAIISRQDPTGKESQWWKVRTKKGDVGYVPCNYIELIRRKKEIELSAGSGTGPSEVVSA